MTAAAYNKITFYSLVVCLNAVVVALVWSLSPLSLFKPHPARTLNSNMSNTLPAQKIIRFGKPTRIVLDSVGIDLPVKPGSFDKSSNEWTLGNYASYYASPSVPPNTSNGNTLIYAHNNHTAFYNLKEVQPGAKLTVYTDTGYTFRYTYKQASEVAPNDLSVFSDKGPPRVTLQTCSGNWNEWRKLFLFSYSSINRQ
jgi:LPXTG-site transpeptidase (sortase) family protein